MRIEFEHVIPKQVYLEAVKNSDWQEVEWENVKEEAREFSKMFPKCEVYLIGKTDTSKIKQLYYNGNLHTEMKV